MNSNSENKKVSRKAVIAITYMVCVLAVYITTQIASDDVVFNAIGIGGGISILLAVPFAYKTVNKLYNAIFSGVSLFGPLQMFLTIFGFKLLVGLGIALFTGPFIAPYTIGNFIAKQLGAE